MKRFESYENSETGQSVMFGVIVRERVANPDISMLKKIESICFYLLHINYIRQQST